jgi:EAL domain-containing protein (putative c-di-GMP-specific phosphodiesterase class I)
MKCFYGEHRDRRGGGDCERPEDLIRDADTAMYEAKRAGRARYAVFDEEMRKRVQRRHLLENELRRAIEGEQFSLAYQPIVSLETGRLKSVEALLRWQHPAHGFISPAEFIPIAEESDLILHIGRWVLNEATRQMAEWVERLGPAAPPTISINLSRKQFAQSDLAEQVRAAAEHSGLPPSRIQLEITEDTFASDVPTAIATMNAIKCLGFLLAIDDFGTGCSSFASLHEFPADVLKIDRSLLIDIETSKQTAALVHALAILPTTWDWRSSLRASSASRKSTYFASSDAISARASILPGPWRPTPLLNSPCGESPTRAM